ncbi:unnamed protein product [Bursaphelenchus xylophilus]|uniref:(pine wood nematode) hypothetical protein n=1 Tax=Bursaphelenchus xylophilus TaxID=6326 RepID=A0A1I7SES0_BURXY|nr:unnamed protein product [Bursaphelenchus xylophilus]CAG9118787.1 unnamed protein product [Bursaphelenchus xylophilus]
MSRWLLVALLALALLQVEVEGVKRRFLRRQQRKSKTPTGHALVKRVNDQGKWKAAYAPYFAKSKPEAIRQLMGVREDVPQVLARDIAKNPRAFSPPTDYNITTIPKEFDSRKAWPECADLINSVQDQSLCGSCWAVSSSTALADRICIATKGKTKVSLSTIDLVSCCSECGYSCVGGYPHRAFKYIYDNGIVTGTNYTHPDGCKPYPFKPCEHTGGAFRSKYPQCYGRQPSPPKCEQKCSKDGYKRTFENDKFYVSTWYNLNKDAVGLQKEIMTNGPAVFTAMRMYEDFLYYRSGVYEHIAGRYFGLHAVRVIGWGEENGVPYWIVANSWNKYWGDNGFFKVRRGNNEVGIESVIDVAIPDIQRSATQQIKYEGV